MDLTQLKKRKLDKLLVVIYSIKTEVKVERNKREKCDDVIMFPFVYKWGILK